MKKFILPAILVLAASCGRNQDIPVYLDDSKPIEARVEDALSRMTLEEKVGMLHAQSKFSSRGVRRLGIPEIWCTDGPHGIRPEVSWDKWSQAGWTNDSCTAYPALTCLAATWDRDLAKAYGVAIGEEARYRNKTVLLGPGVNIYRTPLCGRNFEYMGEDPYLSGQMVAPYVQGVQSNGVAACVKHYALNNQEHNRHTTDVTVDDRTLREIYLPAFEAAVKEGGAWSIMGSYNLYQGEHCCHNDVLLNKILKEEWGFDGVVISDWGGVHDTDEAVRNGMDLEYGTSTNGLSTGIANFYDRYYLALPYQNAILEGKYGTEELDAKVRRLLRLEFRTNMRRDRPMGSMVTAEHNEVARRIGADGIVLLKNEGVLPVPQSASKILVVGENATKVLTVGGGSSSLKAQHEVLPIDGIRAAFPEAEVKFVRGYVGSVATKQDGLSSGQDLSDDRSADELIAEAVEEAAKADYVLFIGGLNKDRNQDCEGEDRLVYGLPYGQDAVIEALAEVAPKLVVVSVSGNAVAMPWVDKVPAIVQDWYLGSESGNSLADVLSGKVNPSGKLPFTFPVALEDGPVKTEAQYPGIRRENSNIYDETYSEGVFVGYRWYEKQQIEPLFAFGHGLSYTSFDYSGFKASCRGGKVKASVRVKNTGDVAGAEVVQLYVSDVEASVDRPLKELKGFEKVWLEPGQEKVVSFELDRRALSFYDVQTSSWVAEPGEFRILVGASSADIRSEASVKL